MLCTNRENHPGQHVVGDAMAKGVIPLGLFDRVWKAHLGLLSERRRDGRAGGREEARRADAGTAVSEAVSQAASARRKLERREARREGLCGKLDLGNTETNPLKQDSTSVLRVLRAAHQVLRVLRAAAAFK